MYKVAGGAFEANVSSAGKVTASATADAALPGLKATLSATLLGGKTDAKVALAYAGAAPGSIGGKLGWKCDAVSAVKITTSLAWAKGAMVLGAEASDLNLPAGSAAKLAVGAQVLLAGGAVAALVAEDSGAARLSYVVNPVKDLTVGAEVARKVGKAGPAFSVQGAAALKHATGTYKASVTDAGLLSASFSRAVHPQLTATTSLQLSLSTSEAAKLGLQLAATA